MDRKEAILRIKDHMEHHGIGKYPHLKLKEALDMAIAALSQPNEPLTLDELREMDGEPVWVELYQAWALVEVKQNGSVMFYGNSFSCSYSRTWHVYRFRPYRRPPEGEKGT